jgi:AcrR family transcriptional regulator
MTSIPGPNSAVKPRRRAAPETAARERRPRISPEVESKVLDAAFRFPARGQDRIARELLAMKVRVSASGVRYVWQRHNLETLEKRIAWIQTQLGSNDAMWSGEQLAARDRMRIDRQARSLWAGMAGQQAEDVSRSTHILSVAARLFRELSYEATSLRDIAARSNIPLGSIYYHFHTKEELFASVYEEGIQRLEHALHEAVSSHKDPWLRLELACACHLDKLCGGDDFTAVSIPTQMPSLSAGIRKRIVQLNDRYEALFRALVDACDIDPRLSRSLVRLQLLGALNWTSVWYNPDRLTPLQIAGQLVRTYRYGVSPHA